MVDKNQHYSYINEQKRIVDGIPVNKEHFVANHLDIIQMLFDCRRAPVEFPKPNVT
jgi:hypothetical protein